MVVVGSSSRSTSSRFGTISTFNVVTPVRLPPGRFRLATSPSLDRVGAGEEDNRNGRGRGLCGHRGIKLLPVAITLTRRRTRSAASAGSRSY